MKLFKFLVKVVLHVTVTTKTPFVKYNTVWRNFYWGTSWLKKYCKFLQKKKKKIKKVTMKLFQTVSISTQDAFVATCKRILS